MPHPTDIKLLQKDHILELSFDNGQQFSLSCEFLRVHSPSAEVQGHSPEQAILVTDKQAVNITNIEAVGSYAIKLFFDDGHNSGIYTFDYLYKLCNQHDALWEVYQAQLAQL